jgi:hypothetical protein
LAWEVAAAAEALFVELDERTEKELEPLRQQQRRRR